MVLKMPLPVDWQDAEAQANLAAIQGSQPQQPVAQSVPTKEGILDVLLGPNREQLWPERLIRDAISAPHDVLNSKTPLTSQDLIKPALDMSALAGTGGLGGAEAGGIKLGIVPVDIAKKLNVKSTPASDVLKAAVENTPGAKIDEDGHLILDMVRHQGSDQALSDSVRGGVFYLPKGDKNARYYDATTKSGGANNYGGQDRIEGQTAFKNPLVVKGATGGKAPENAYIELKGKDAFKKLDADVMEVVTASNWMKKKDPQAFYDLINRFIDTHAPEMNGYADHILENSKHGNQLKYALQEAAVASAAREAGHDGIIGFSELRGADKGKKRISEIFDVRENQYPNESGDYSIHPQFYSDSSLPGAGIAAARNRAFLRPALKYEGKIYKAPMGGQHMDAIPKDLQAEFTRQAMSGEDISNFNFGFMNHKGQFLDREKALDYAIKEGLLSPHDARYGALTSTMEIK